MDTTARGLALAAGKANTRQAFKDELLRSEQWGARYYVIPANLPIVAPHATQRVDSTAYSIGALVLVGARVYLAIAPGTGSGTSGVGTSQFDTSAYIVDGGVVWSYLGYVAPVAWAQGLTVYAGTQVYNAGEWFEALNAGTAAASGTGPTPTSLSDNGITWRYLGKQTKPLVTQNLVATYANSTAFTAGQYVAAGSNIYLVTVGGTSSSQPSHTSGTQTVGGVTYQFLRSRQVDWNSSKLTALGGTLTQIGANFRAALKSISSDGNAYQAGSGGGGSIYTVTNAPSLGFYYNQFMSGTSIWVDGEYVALFTTKSASAAATTFRELFLDFSGVAMPRQQRVIRYETDASPHLVGLYASSADDFRGYTPASKRRGVIMGDSFVESTANGTIFVLGFAARLGHFLGIEDWRVSGLGGTGILKTSGSSVNYATRYTQDMISQSPDLAIIVGTQNDTAFTVTQVGDGLSGLLTRNKSEIPNAQTIVFGVWSNRGTLSTTPAQINTELQTRATAAGVPFVDQSDFTTDGGYAGSPSGTGTSLYITAGDGTHRTPHGHAADAEKFRQRMRATIQALT